jgi:ketosteroid isomerase-like protein
MTTRNTVTSYFEALSAGTAWQSFLADAMTFTSHAAPQKQVTGRDAFVESTRGFYSMVRNAELRKLIVDGDRACAVARYELEPPQREAFTCDVAEVFTVRDGRIDSFEIFFDSAPFRR